MKNFCETYLIKNFLILLVINFLFHSCATGEKLVAKGKIKPNLSKQGLQDALLISYPGDDPFISGGGSEFYPDKNTEIIWGEKGNLFYVFKDVSKTVTCGRIICRAGNGTLVSWHNSLIEARASLVSKSNDNKSEVSSSDDSGSLNISNKDSSTKPKSGTSSKSYNYDN